MQSWGLIALAVALFLACLVSYPLFVGVSNYSANYCFISVHTVGHAALSYMSHLLLVAAKTNSPSHFYPNKSGRRQKTESDDSGSKLSVFKGREAKLNRAILLVLFQNGPLVVYDITKEVKKRKGFRFTKYTNVNRRVRALTQQGYLESVGSRDTQSGSQGTLYQPTIRAKVAFYLNEISPDQFIKEATDEALTTELAALALFLEKANLQE
jgi:hypothetical protein